MNPNVLVAAITSASSMAVAIVALVLNHHGFAAMEKRFERIEHRLDVIEADLKEFYKVLARHETDIARLKD